MRPVSSPRLAILNAVLLLVPVSLGAACVGERPEAPRVAQPAPRAPDPLADGAAALAGTDARRFVQSSWRVSLSGAAGAVSIADDKQLLVLPGGDFDLSIRRVHEGAGAGRSDESYRAIRKDRVFFTRGSGGAFVRWDDALDEPSAALSMPAGEARSLLAAIAPCADVAWTGMSATVRAGRTPCVAKLDGLLEGAGLEIRELNGEVRVDRGALVHASLLLRGVVATPSGQREAALTWRLDASEPVATAKVEVPADAIDGRRERPARMIDEVLGGLDVDLGPGAAGVLRARHERKAREDGGQE